MKSLRRRLIVGILAGAALALGLGSILAFVITKERLHAELDRSLSQRAVSLAGLITVEAGILQIGWLEQGNEPPGHAVGTEYFRVMDKTTGEVLAVSKELTDWELFSFGGSLEQPELGSVKLPGYRPGRCASVEFFAALDVEDETDREDNEPVGAALTGAATETGAQLPLVQLVFARVDTVGPTMATIQRFLAGLWLGGLSLTAIVIWIVVRQGLRPLDHLRDQIRSLDQSVSGQRIVFPNPPSELVPVTDELNRLLERVEKALVRERALTSNVAHELRTPIAGLLSNLEVTLTRLRSPKEYRESSEECFEIAKRLHWLVTNLLSVARIESGNVRLQRSVVRISEAFSEWWEPFSSQASSRGIRVSWEIRTDMTVETDPEFLRVIATNLFNNAVSYTPDGGTIRISADKAGSISVANQSVNLNAEILDRVFEPFWRNTEAREENDSHAGLGLSLCKKIVELLGGRITARLNEPGSWFVVRLEMV